MNVPEIRIKYNAILDPVFIFYTQNHPSTEKRGWHEWNPPLESEIQNRTKKYQETWKKYGEKILAGIVTFFELSFSESIIYVHVVSGTQRSFSNPLIIKSGFTEDEFIMTITHELIHCLLQGSNKKLALMERDLFPTVSDSTRSHIIVHAALEYVYVEILKRPDFLIKNKENSANHSTDDYQKAWEIVEERGYQELIKLYKENYELY